MAKRIMRFRGQLDLFKDTFHPVGENFVSKLLGLGLVSKTVSRKRAVQGKPKKINVLDKINNAYSLLEGKQGVNIEKLLDLLQKSPVVYPEKILQDESIFARIGRNKEERAGIKKAVEIISLFVNRKKKLDELRRMHAKTRREYAGQKAMDNHLKSIHEK